MSNKSIHIKPNYVNSPSYRKPKASLVFIHSFGGGSAGVEPTPFMTGVLEAVLINEKCSWLGRMRLV